MCSQTALSTFFGQQPNKTSGFCAVLDVLPLQSRAPAGPPSYMEVGLYSVTPCWHITQAYRIATPWPRPCTGSKELDACQQLHSSSPTQLQQLLLVCEKHSQGLKAFLRIKGASDRGAFHGRTAQVEILKVQMAVFNCKSTIFYIFTAQFYISSNSSKQIAVFYWLFLFIFLRINTVLYWMKCSKRLGTSV